MCNNYCCTLHFEVILSFPPKSLYKCRHRIRMRICPCNETYAGQNFVDHDIIDTDTYIPIKYSSLSKMSRYKCQCCKYKRNYRLFATTCVRHDFREVDVQTLCTYLKVPIERPAEWPLLDSKQTYVRPSVLWELDRQGTIEIWSQRPNKLEGNTEESVTT